MTTDTLTLTDFLLARIAEDEALADRAGSFNGPEAMRNDNYGNLTVQPSRIRAECEAKRAIVELHDRQHECSTYDRFGEVDNCTWCLGASDCSTICALAAVYADHPDYRGAWAT